ncbi:MAG: hypothetical protein QM774_07700 [Gordonia sp. (in: high G+C Gram-positive bacteria)]|uniref:hypothetical protein n=1 Tax=Gordonia sp. (in: high G+C Gram-positive bacteria) TaxID=84139 RepID=UPI0039E71AD2
MKLYADTPVRRSRQIVGDLAVVAWIAFVIWLGTKVYDVAMKLAVPGQKIDEAATSLGDKLRDAGGTADRVPVVGDQFAKPFGGAGGAADAIADAGRAQVDAVHTFSWWIGVAVAVVPILLALAIYIPPRWRFIKRASTHVALRDTHAGVDLLALRALSSQPLKSLTAISDDPAGDWRRGHRQSVQALAALELRDTGLRPREVIADPGSAADAP